MLERFATKMLRKALPFNSSRQADLARRAAV
jgi:hypothetical protein